MRRFWRWLQAPEFQGVPYERVIALREEAYRIGVAVGELKGRRELSAEIQVMYSGHEAMTAEDAQNVKARQVH